MERFISYILNDSSYFLVFGLVFLYFLVLYFGLAPAFEITCRYLEKKGVLHKIVNKEVPTKQIHSEIRHSVVSIFIFGLSGPALVFLVRMGAIDLLADSLINVLLGVSILTIWNEVHFYLIHRIMHLPFFMRKVHYVHHRSKIPTVYSVFSFHWLEALLLSTVPLCIAPFVPFAASSFAIFPLVSIVLNLSGHCNYRFGKGLRTHSLSFATKHNKHHTSGKGNYSFALDWLDRFSRSIQKKNSTSNSTK